MRADPLARQFGSADYLPAGTRASDPGCGDRVLGTGQAKCINYTNRSTGWNFLPITAALGQPNQESSTAA